MSGRAVHEAYRVAINKPCPKCGAAAGEYCVVIDSSRRRRTRRMPCVRRCLLNPTQPVDPTPLRPAARSFDEPLHDPEEKTQ